MNRQDINRVVVLVNPMSTRHNSVRSQLNDLQESFGSKLQKIESYSNPVDTSEMLKEQLEPNDLVVTAGGDGTARTAVEALADPAAVGAHHSVVLPLPGGNRNDLARQLHGHRFSSRPSTLIDESVVVDILPLQTTIEHDELQDRRLSALYTGLGAIAAAAHRISSREFRSQMGYSNAFMRHLHGLSLLPWALKYIEDTSVYDEDGTERTLFDAALVNSRILAQYLQPPVDLLDNEAFYTELKGRSAREVVPYVVRLMTQPYLAPPAHCMIEPGEEIGFTLRNPAYVHTDGDAELLPAGAHVRFGLHTTAFRALCTRDVSRTTSAGQLSDTFF